MANKAGMGEPNRNSGRTELDSSDMDAMIREDVENAGEPEVRVEEDKVIERPTKPEPEPRPAEDDLRKALSTIESLRGEVETLKRARPVASDKEPSIMEMEEVLQNVRLPKDPTKWPIQITKADMAKVGLDESAAPGLNILGNALYAFVADTIPEIAIRAVLGRLDSRDRSSQNEKTFLESYPDLQGMQDIMGMVENDEFFQSHRHLPKGEYMDKLAEAGRRRVAAIRGMSYEDYSRNVKAPPAKPGAGRAITTSSGRTNRTRPSNESKEMDDMWNG